MAEPMTQAAPWPPPAPWRQLRRARRRLRFTADEKVRGQIAETLDLEAVKAVDAELSVGPWLDGVEIAGRLRAVVTRICGISLDPFDEAIDEAIRLRVVPAGSPNAPGRAGAGLIVVADDDDPPEEARGDVVDLAALMIEHLAVGLSPYPRRPGLAFEAPPEVASASPFAALAAWKDSGAPD